MNPRKLTREFFDRDTKVVAKELLGKVLVRKINGKKVEGVIIETEAYCGLNDLASHASRGRTSRTEVMFGKPGMIYVYFIYGMYHCLNIVTEKENYPAAVLIRSCELILPSPKQIKNSNKKLPVTSYGLPVINLNGPGKLCRYFQIDRGLNAEDLIASKELWIEDGGIIIKPTQIKCLSRVGVDYAGKYKDKKWRYYVKL
ncbi:MAG: DNA-3-methyladenine glycosylase [bacterium]|nr:DNA-3-methyladenine glycosylase [bacterium]